MKSLVLVLTTIIAVSAATAQTSLSTGIQRYDARVSAKQAQRASYNTPPTHLDSTRVGGAGLDSVYRGVVPYRSFNTPRSPYSGSYLSPVTGSLPTTTYPKTSTGLNISNIPQSSSQLPYISRDTTGIQSGMPRFDQYRSNQILAQTYSRGIDLRPFTEDIRDFEYYLQERNLRTPEQVQQQRDLLSRKYQIDASENADVSRSDFGGFINTYPETKAEDFSKEPSADDIFGQILAKHKEAGLEGLTVEDGQNSEDAQESAEEEAQGREDVDLSDKMALRQKARAVLGEFKSFAGYSNDRFNTYMRRAEEFMGEGEFYKAADAYALAAIFRKNDPLVYAGQSLALLGAGEYMSSSFYLNRAIQLYPDYIAIKIDLVEMLGDKDVLDNRIVDIKRWMERSGAGELSFLLAYIYYQMNEMQWAIEELEKAEGNPFFIEEVIRNFIDEGIIEVKDNHFVVTDKIQTADVPATINEVILSRIEKLDEKTKNLLKTASAIGRNFYYKVLQEATDTISELDDKLEYLKDVQLINERKEKDEIEFLFKHALAQQATYESILLQSRKELHLKIARSIEKVFAEKINEFPESGRIE